jgi:hypothetical protein
MKNPLKEPVFLVGSTALALMLTCSSASSAQSLGDIARQERDRQKDLPHRSAYVYTNEDLKRAQILTPEDRERAIAGQIAEQAPEAVAATAVAPPDPLSAPPDLSFLSGVGSVISIEVPFLDEFPARPRKRLFARRRVENPQPPVIASQRPEKLPAASTFLASRLAKPSATFSANSGNAAASSSLRSLDHAFAAENSHAHANTHAVENATAIEAPSIQVQPGDSLWKLAKFYLGSGARWREIAALNPEVTNPDVIRTGERIRVRVG